MTPEEVLADVDFGQKLERRFRIEWPADSGAPLTDAERRVVERTEFVFLTWDPFGWHEDVEVDRLVVVTPGDPYRLTAFYAAKCVAGFADPYPGRGFGAHAERVVRIAAEHEDSLIDGSFDERSERGEIEDPRFWIDWEPSWPDPDLVDVGEW